MDRRFQHLVVPSLTTILLLTVPEIGVAQGVIVGLRSQGITLPEEVSQAGIAQVSFASPDMASLCASHHVTEVQQMFAGLGPANEWAVAHSGEVVHLYVPRNVFSFRADYIVAFYNRSRRHGHLGGVSPEQFETAHKARCQGVH